MKVRKALCIVVVASLIPLLAGGQAADIDRQLEEATSLYRDANFADAVVQLQGTIERLQRLQTLAARKAQLVDAHLLLALSYFALEQRGAAKKQFVDVLRLDPARTLDPQVYAPPVLLLFQEARAETPAASHTTRPTEASPSSPAATSSASGKKGRGKPVLIGLGIAGIAAGGAAAASGGGEGNGGSRTESGVASVSPAGIALASVTQLTFTATGFSKTPTWVFGDGGRATGFVVTHTYSTEGSFLVTAQTDGAASTLSVPVRSLTGRWVADYELQHHAMQITQVGTSLSGGLTITHKAGSPFFPSSGTAQLEGSVVPPRTVSIRELDGCLRVWRSLQLSADLTTLTGMADEVGNPICSAHPETYLRQ